jgi:hypothetical protein
MEEPRFEAGSDTRLPFRNRVPLATGDADKA